MSQQRTWFVIADAGRARVLQRLGRNGALTEVPGMRIEEHVPATHEIVTDRPGRTMVSGGATRHAYASHTDPHREAKRHFMQKLARQLEESLAADAFDRLVLVAPPQALGDLRAALSAQVARHVAADLHKDLTRIPDDEMPGHLADIA